MGKEEPRRRRAAPLVEGVSEGAHAAVDAGYQVLDSLLYGARESLRRQGPEASPAPPRPRPQRQARRRQEGPRQDGPRKDGPAPARRTGPPGAPRELIEEIADLFAEALDRGADLAQDVAGYIDERPWSDRSDEPAAPLELGAAPGEEASVEFRLSNTGPTALKEIELAATELLWGRRRLAFESVSFEPATVARIRPGGHESVTISIAVPPETEPGTYRGLVEASPGGAWAALELTVATKPERVERPARPEPESV